MANNIEKIAEFLKFRDESVLPSEVDDEERNETAKSILELLQFDCDPVAVRYDFDGHGYQYLDNGSGSDWASRKPEGEFLYEAQQPSFPTEATPEMIAEAWSTWKSRGGYKLGPGPAFVEAINAAIAKGMEKKP